MLSLPVRVTDLLSLREGSGRRMRVCVPVGSVGWCVTEHSLLTAEHGEAIHSRELLVGDIRNQPQQYENKLKGHVVFRGARLLTSNQSDSIMKTPQFKQRNVWTRVNFLFSDSHVNYSIINHDGKRIEFNVKYSDLPNPFSYKTFKSKDNLILYPLFLAGFIAIFRIVLGDDDLYSLGIALLICSGIAVAAGYGLRRSFKRQYTALPIPGGNILVVEDYQHDAIIALLQEKRQQALKKFLVVDPSLPVWMQIKKYKWLRDEHIISDEDLISYKSMLLSSTNSATVNRKAVLFH